MFKNDFPYNWSHFADCETGFNGSSCDQQCPYPSYGLNCASKCNCIYKDCHYQYGCKKSRGGIFLSTIITARYYNCFISSSVSTEDISTIVLVKILFFIFTLQYLSHFCIDYAQIFREFVTFQTPFSNIKKLDINVRLRECPSTVSWAFGFRTKAPKVLKVENQIKWIWVL